MHLPIISEVFVDARSGAGDIFWIPLHRQQLPHPILRGGGARDPAHQVGAAIQPRGDCRRHRRDDYSTRVVLHPALRLGTGRNQHCYHIPLVQVRGQYNFRGWELACKPIWLLSNILGKYLPQIFCQNNFCITVLLASIIIRHNQAAFITFVISYHSHIWCTVLTYPTLLPSNGNRWQQSSK